MICLPLLRVISSKEVNDLVVHIVLNSAESRVSNDIENVTSGSLELLVVVGTDSDLDVEDGILVQHHRGIHIISKLNGIGTLNHVDVEVEDLNNAIVGRISVEDVSGESTSNGVADLSGDASRVEVGDADGEEEGGDVGDVGLDGRVDVGSEEEGVVVLGLAVASEGTPELVALSIEGLRVLVVVRSRNGVVGVVPDGGLVPGGALNGDGRGDTVLVIDKLVALVVLESSALGRSELDLKILQDDVVLIEVGRNLLVELSVDVVQEVEAGSHEGIVKVVGVLVGSVEKDGQGDVGSRGLVVGDVGDVGISHGDGGLVLEGVLNETLHPGRHVGGVDVGVVVVDVGNEEVAGDVTVTSRNGGVVVVLVADGLVVQDLGSHGEGVVDADVLVGSGADALLAVVDGIVVHALVERKVKRVLGVEGARGLGIDLDVAALELAGDDVGGGDGELEEHAVGLLSHLVVGVEGEGHVVDGAVDVLGRNGETSVGELLILLLEEDAALGDGPVDDVGDGTLGADTTAVGGADDGLDGDGDLTGLTVGSRNHTTSAGVEAAVGKDEAVLLAGAGGVGSVGGEGAEGAGEDVGLDVHAVSIVVGLVDALDLEVDGGVHESGDGVALNRLAIAVGDVVLSGTVDEDCDIVVALQDISGTIIIAIVATNGGAGLGDGVVISVTEDGDVLTLESELDVVSLDGTTVVGLGLEDINAGEGRMRGGHDHVLEVGVGDALVGERGAPAGSSNTLLIVVLVSLALQSEVVVLGGQAGEDSVVGIEKGVVKVGGSVVLIDQLTAVLGEVAGIDLDTLGTGVGGGELLDDDGSLVVAALDGTNGNVDDVGELEFVIAVQGGGVGEVTDGEALKVVNTLVSVGEGDDRKEGIIIPGGGDELSIGSHRHETKGVLALGNTVVELMDVTGSGDTRQVDEPLASRAGGLVEGLAGVESEALSVVSVVGGVLTGEDDGVVVGGGTL